MKNPHISRLLFNDYVEGQIAISITMRNLTDLINTFVQQNRYLPQQ
jgi:hypothetical protein